MSERLDEAVRELYRIPKFTKKNSPEHTRAFLRELGDPQEDFPVIHVAGSNGKGSVCVFLNEMLRGTGARTGLFVSPHLTDIRERFVVDDEMCSEEEFLDAYEDVKEAVRRLQAQGLPHPTFFEILFAVGMRIFSCHRVDCAVLETGLGGRLDATNIVRRPFLTVITSISLEHTQYLGDTIPQIAGEKAGILKPGVPAVYDASDPEAAAVIARRAAELGCPAVPVGPESVRIREINRKGIDFSLSTAYDKKTDWTVPFPAEYQGMNAALALTGFRILQKKGLLGAQKLTDADLQRALSRAKWPGRMEEVLPDVYLDGAHNPDAVRAFARTVEKLCEKDEEKPLLLFAMVKDKDYRQAAQILSSEISWDSVMVSSAADERALPAEDLAAVFVEAAGGKFPVRAIPGAEAAWKQALAKKKEGQKLFCAGSLYFIGELEVLAGREIGGAGLTGRCQDCRAGREDAG